MTADLSRRRLPPATASIARATATTSRPNGRTLRWQALGLALTFLPTLALVDDAAACSDRPGTPNNVSAIPESSSSIRFNWNDTTKPGEIPLGPFYDIEVTDKNGNLQPQGSTGEGYLFGGKVFVHLDFDKTYCFRVRARTDKGTGGCVSQHWSARVCAQTPYPSFLPK